MLSNQTLAWIGAGTVAVMVWVFRFALDQVKRSVNERLERKEKEDRDYRKEQIDDAYHALRGQQVTCDCLHEMLRHMITGDHIDDLERVQAELEAYRRLNTETMTRKAAKYDLR